MSERPLPRFSSSNDVVSLSLKTSPASSTLTVAGVASAPSASMPPTQKTSAIKYRQRSATTAASYAAS